MGVYEVERIVSGRYETQLWFWWYSVLTEMFRTLFNLNLVHMTQLLNNASLGENASYCPQKRGKNSLGTLLGIRREQLSRAFRTFRCSFRRWSFDNTCGHRINAKFHQSLVEISNLLYQRVPKSWSTFVENKKQSTWILISSYSNTNAKRNSRIFQINLIKLIEDQRLGWAS